MRPASPPLTMTDGQRDILEKLAKSHTAPHRDVTHAKALLLAGKGAANTAIAWELGVSASSVTSWRNRFEEEGLKKFGKVKSGRGRKPSIPPEKVAEIVHATLHEKPVGETHWSCRSMAKGSRCQPGDGAADVVGARPEAASGQDVQALERPAIRGEARRRRRPLSEPAGQRHGAVHGRKEPDPGARPHPAEPADEEGPRRDNDPRLQAQRHDDLVRRPRTCSPAW